MPNRNQTLLAWLSHLGGWAIFTFALQVLFIPLIVAVPLAGGISYALVQSHGAAGHMALAFSTLIAFGIFEIGARLSVSPPERYSRPHEKFSSEDFPYYIPNSQVDEFDIPYGDLFSLSDHSIPTIIEPRRVRFLTDGLGFRNQSDYEGHSFVLFGDSFGLGTGGTQGDTIPELLERDHGIPTYNASWPSGPADYVDTHRYLSERVGTNFRSIFLIFEGNDLSCKDEKLHFDVFRRWYGYVVKPVRNLHTFRTISRLLRRATNHLGITKTGKVSVWPIGGKDVGFYDPYVIATTRPSGDGCDWEEEFVGFPEIRENLSLLVFAPTKYRVYQPLLPGRAQAPLPNARALFVEELAERLGVPFLDLTPTLTRHSRQLLGEGRYTYWRDDTHWSPTGMDLVAQEIAGALPALQPLQADR